MDWQWIRSILLNVQHFISLCGVLIILSGLFLAIFKYLIYIGFGQITKDPAKINAIRLMLGRTLILGLEFIVAADLISTTTTPDYYSLGVLAIIVFIRTLLSFSLNKELKALSRKSE